MQSSTDNFIIANLQLARSENVGPITYHHLLAQFKTANAALDAIPELAKRGGRKRRLKTADKQDILAEIDAVAAHGGRFIVHNTQDYPPLLNEIPDAPPVIGVYGNLACAHAPAIAIVGARNASATAHRITAILAEGVSAHKIAIVSGMARGVDTTAHKAALPKIGGTIAVLGTGIDTPYPAENTELQAQIQEKGLIISENPPKTAPHASLFPRRNRIIAGLSLGVLVVEAARRSGSLITARLAAEQSREVMAVPGTPIDIRCNGSNNLLREGAGFIETVDDIMQIIQPLIERNSLKSRETSPPRKREEPAPTFSDNERQTVIDLLSPTPTNVDEIIAWAQLPVPVVLLVLLELELAQRLERDVFGRVSLID